MEINVDINQPEEATPIVIDVATGASYPILDGKPQINGVTLLGNKTSEELGLQPQGDYALKSDIVSTDKFATKTELNSKQDKLVAGNNITIVNNVISATGGSGGGGAIDAYTKAETNTLLNSKQDKGNYALKSEIPVNTSDLTNDSGFITIADIPNIDIEGAVTDVKVNGTSVLADGVANIPIATDKQAGLVRPVSANGIYVSNTGTLNLSKLSNASLANKSSNYAVLVSQIDLATKVGVTTNTIELTDEEKTNACNWLGAIKPSDLGNATITLKQGGITKGSFTTNQSNDISINLDAGGTGGGGQSSPWVFSNTILMNSRTEIGGVIEFDLSSYLPDDGLTYLVYGNARAEAKEGTENNFNIFAYSDLIPETTLIELCSKYNTSSSWGDRATGSFLIPIGTGRKLGVYNSGSKTSKMVWLRLVMYQQITFERGV